MTKALILDCDDVLADTERDGHLVAFNQVFDEAGYPFRWSEDEYAKLLKVGGGKERLKAYLLDHPEIELPGMDDLDALLAEVHRRKSYDYQQIVNGGHIPGRPGIKRLVEEALDGGWQVAVASTSAVPSVEAVAVAVFGQATRDRLFGIYGGDIVKAKKPAPDITCTRWSSWVSNPARRWSSKTARAGRRRRPRPASRTSSRSATSPRTTRSRPRASWCQTSASRTPPPS